MPATKKPTSATKKPTSATKKPTSATKKPASKSPVRIKLKAVGSLTRFGYHADKSDAVRHAALKKAIKANGRTEVIRRLNVLYIYNKNRNPKLALKFKLDMTWVQAQPDK